MFTVGICSSERKDFLLQALESVMAQDYNGPIEVVVADDNSTSFSVEEVLKPVAHAFSSRNIKLRLVKSRGQSTEDVASNKNLDSSIKAGEGVMRNLVVTHSSKDSPSKNQYIIWLDDDDRLIKNALTNYFEAIQANPETDVFYGNLIRTDVNFAPQQRYQYRDIPRALLPSSLLLGSIIPNGGTCIRKEVYEKVGLYDPSYAVAVDYQFWARASLGPIRFKYINKDVYLYRAHSGNLALDKEDDRFYETNARVCELLLQNCPPNYLFPFFEWKNNKPLAECQVTLAVLTIATRNRRKVLIENCNKELETNKELVEQLTNSPLESILKSIKEVTELTFDQTANILAKIVEAGQKIDN